MAFVGCLGMRCKNQVLVREVSIYIMNKGRVLHIPREVRANLPQQMPVFGIKPFPVIRKINT